MPGNGENYVAIIDGGGANIASLQFALQRLNANTVLTSDHDVTVFNKVRIERDIAGAGFCLAVWRVFKQRRQFLNLRTIERKIQVSCQLYAVRHRDSDFLNGYFAHAESEFGRAFRAFALNSRT